MDTLTEGHRIPGTPIYMSPEQLQDAAGVTTQSDVYSLVANAIVAVLLLAVSALLTLTTTLVFYALHGPALGFDLTAQGLTTAPAAIAFEPVWTSVTVGIFLLHSRQQLHRYEWRLRQITAVSLREYTTATDRG